jgi:carboxypeptidase C (cathepsin A)
MLYIDQPAGVGFSYNPDETASSVTCGDSGSCTLSRVVNATVEVNSTVAAAPFVWTFTQAFFDAFPQYEKRELGIWTESYGGHYGPGKIRNPLFSFSFLLILSCF